MLILLLGTLRLLRVCTANFSTPVVSVSTMHTVAVNATTAASEAKYSKRCNSCADREGNVEVLITRCNVRIT
jgi:hypothetical protein